MHESQVLEMFGHLLGYPQEDLGPQSEALQHLLEDPAAIAALEEFRRKLALMRVEILEEHYTRAFDLAPQAVPYLGVHLFGAESPQRGQFMAGLNGAYAAAGFDAQGELPDHLAVVLRYAGIAPAKEWMELRQWCFQSPLRNMHLSLEKADNLYQHLIMSLKTVLSRQPAGEPIHA